MHIETYKYRSCLHVLLKSAWSRLFFGRENPRGVYPPADTFAWLIKCKRIQLWDINIVFLMPLTSIFPQASTSLGEKECAQRKLRSLSRKHIYLSWMRMLLDEMVRNPYWWESQQIAHMQKGVNWGKGAAVRDLSAELCINSWLYLIALEDECIIFM